MDLWAGWVGRCGGGLMVADYSDDLNDVFVGGDLGAM